MQNSHRWGRLYAIISGQNLHLQNFQHHERSSGASIDLARAIAINFYPCRHDCGLDNVIQVHFDDRRELLAYADSEQQGFAWTDAIYRAVWSQPYVPAA